MPLLVTWGDVKASIFYAPVYEIEVKYVSNVVKTPCTSQFCLDRKQ